MLYYSVSYDSTFRKVLIRVEDPRVKDFEISMDVFENKDERELHGWIQGIIAAKIRNYENNRANRLPIDRHDRGWPKHSRDSG